MIFVCSGKRAGQMFVQMPHGIKGRYVYAAVLHRAVRVQQQRAHSPHLGVGHGAKCRDPVGITNRARVGDEIKLLAREVAIKLRGVTFVSLDVIPLVGEHVAQVE